MGGRLFGLFSCSLKAQGGHLSDATGFLVTMDNDLLHELRTRATAALQAAAKAADDELTRARAGVADAETRVAGLDRDIAARRHTVAAEREGNPPHERR